MIYSGFVIFKSTDLISVIQEAKDNHCQVLLVKDHGLYMMSEKGALNQDTGRRRVAYAEGFNPDIVDFDGWYDKLHDICGGDDFAEYINQDDPAFNLVFRYQFNLRVDITETTFQLHPVTQ